LRIITLRPIAHPSPIPPIKGDQIGDLILASSAAISLSVFSALTAIFFPCHGRKLTVSYFLPDHEVLQWRPAACEDIPTPNTNEIVVFTSFFQRGFEL
jgi:hypothetical protein